MSKEQKEEYFWFSPTRQRQLNESQKEEEQPPRYSFQAVMDPKSIAPFKYFALIDGQFQQYTPFPFSLPYEEPTHRFPDAKYLGKGIHSHRTNGYGKIIDINSELPLSHKNQLEIMKTPMNEVDHERCFNGKSLTEEDCIVTSKNSGGSVIFFPVMEITQPEHSRRQTTEDVLKKITKLKDR